MPFDMAWDFREHVGFVTDPAYGVAMLGEAYPTLYTNANGDSINAGRQSTGHFQIDTLNTNDPRIAGAVYGWDVDGFFQVDLTSGSAPGAGNYLVDVALGYDPAGIKMDFKLYDDTTLLIDGTNGGAGFTTSAGQYLDASLAMVPATTTWTGTQVPVTFATTTVKLQVQTVASSNTFLAHFRLTRQAGATAKPWGHYARQMSA